MIGAGDIPLGVVVHEATNKAPWVYVGWRRTSVDSIEHFFIRASEDRWFGGYPWAYHAVMRGTLTKKFPDLEQVLSVKPSQQV